MKQVRVGLVGAGFAAKFHAECYKEVPGIDVVLAGVYSEEGAKELAGRYGAVAHSSFDDLLSDKIDVVDICTPASTHADYAIKAAKAGRHAIVEKPLTGCFGGDWDGEKPMGLHMPREKMLAPAMYRVADIAKAFGLSGTKLMYAENWCYLPGIDKVMELLEASRATIIRMVGEESHSGSHATYYDKWEEAGGGSLMGKAVHPLGAALILKYEEGKRKGIGPIRPVYVSARVFSLTGMDCFKKAEVTEVKPGIFMTRDGIRVRYQDVEDFGEMTVEFQDGSVAQIMASETVLGGVQNRFEAQTDKGRVICRVNPINAIQAYTDRGENWGDVYIVEKIGTKQGWTSPSPDEDWITGYHAEMRDFMNCVAEAERQPRSGLMLGQDTVATIYSAYISAAKNGERVGIPLE